MAGGGAEAKLAWPPALVRAKALRGAGELARRQGDLAAARAYFEEGVRIAGGGRHCGRSPESSYGLGLVAVQQGDLRAARTYFEESLAGGRELGTTA